MHARWTGGVLFGENFDILFLFAPWRLRVTPTDPPNPAEWAIRKQRLPWAAGRP